VFRCETPQCGHEEHDTVDRGLIVVPNACTKCGKKQTMRMIPNRSGFLNRQVRAMAYSTAMLS
jgi:DNA replicative helicase MCM subunit Mcm2 (Cdc46/Mcm family)